MERIVVDTDALINYSRGKAAPLTALFEQEARGTVALMVSTVTLFEYYSGLGLESATSRERADILFSQFSVQDVTPIIAKMAARYMRMKKLEGKVGKLDALIAATVIVCNAKLLTENRRHFMLIPGVPFVE